MRTFATPDLTIKGYFCVYFEMSFNCLVESSPAPGTHARGSGHQWKSRALFGSSITCCVHVHALSTGFMSTEKRSFLLFFESRDLVCRLNVDDIRPADALSRPLFASKQSFNEVKL